MKYKDIILIFYCLLIVILTFGIGRISGKISYQSDILKENLNIQNYLPSIDIRRYSPVSETEQSLLNKMSKEKLEKMVFDIIEDRLHTGQLDDCDLTLRDLSKIRKCFLKALGGIYHQRIVYPSEKTKL